MSAEGLVEATERLYRSLFSGAVGFAAATAVWGLVIAPFNGFRDEHAGSIALGLVLSTAGVAAWRCRGALFGLLRQQQAWLLAVVVIGIGALWIDGGWRSSYYLVSYSAILLAAVVGGLRWTLACATLLATGYLAGLALHGYSWAQLQDLKDADSVVANTGGYLIAGAFFALPVAWLGGYVARINQIAGRPGSAGPVARAGEGALAGNEPRARHLKTADLSVREVEVAQLVAAGMTNEKIAESLFLSPRTIQRHVDRAMKKTAAKNRAELAAIAVREGIVPASLADELLTTD